MTVPPTQPDLEARITELAKRLHYHGPNAREQILHRALKTLEDSLPPPRSAEEESAVRWAAILERGRELREKYPYDDDNPPSKVWQEELYDENGLPK